MYVMRRFDLDQFSFKCRAVQHDVSHYSTANGYCRHDDPELQKLTLLRVPSGVVISWR